MDADIPGVLLNYAEEAADRLRAWSVWHIDRGERRGVSQTSIKALWSVAAAVDDLTWAMRQSADGAALAEFSDAILIPTLTDQNPHAQSRNPNDMTRHGWSTSLFQAWQQWSTMSS